MDYLIKKYVWKSWKVLVNPGKLGLENVQNGLDDIKIIGMYLKYNITFLLEVFSSAPGTMTIGHEY
jgi:hypothetical protein